MNNVLDKIKLRLNNNLGVLRNFSYLSLLQIFNLTLPLITYPYLISVLGKEIYGTIIFAQAIVGYLMILVGFGFNISATKHVSLNRNDRDKLNEIISSVFLIKFALFLLSVIILAVIVITLPQAKGYEILFFFTLWMCIYDIVFPVWYFQGIEEMKYITYITLISRLIFLALIFLLIHKPEDYLFLPIINGIGAITGGVVSLIIIFKKHHLRLKRVTLGRLRLYCIDTFAFFVSNISTTLYLTLSKVILGAFVGMREVAYYDLADKLSTVLKTPIQLIGQAIYPSVAKNKNLLFLRKTFIITILVALGIMTFGLGAGKFMVKILGGVDMNPSISIFKILIISIIPVSVSLFYANLSLVSWGFNKDYLKLRLYTNGLYVLSIASLYLLNSINIYSLAILAIVVETCAALLAYYFASKRRINFLSKEV